MGEKTWNPGFGIMQAEKIHGSMSILITQQLSPSTEALAQRFSELVQTKNRYSGSWVLPTAKFKRFQAISACYFGQGCIKLLDFSLSSIGWRRGLGRGGA